MLFSKPFRKEDKWRQSTVHFSCKWLLKGYEPIKHGVFYKNICSCAVPYACTMSTVWTDGLQQWKAKRFNGEKRVTVLLTAWLASSYYIIIAIGGFIDQCITTIMYNAALLLLSTFLLAMFQLQCTVLYYLASLEVQL